MSESKRVLIEVKDVKKYFPLKKKSIFQKHILNVKAVDGVTVNIYEGETLGLVGESGCGKSTFGRTVLNLYEPTEGSVTYFKEGDGGIELSKLPKEQMRRLRRDLQIIFQDPYSSLNPRKRIGHILMEPMLVHGIVANRDEAREDAQRLLREVGLRSEHAERFAHQLSGGQRQRVAIARALAMRPEFIVCDEAVSALDVSVQAQVVNLLTDLQERLNLSYLFIGHDLAVVRQIATRVVVMYLGRVVEIADRDDFYRQPMHPYSQALMAAVPSVEALGLKTQKKFEIRGEPPSPMAPPSGCAFRTRCALAGADCADTVPELRTVAVGRQVACLRVA